MFVIANDGSGSVDDDSDPARTSYIFNRKYC